MTWFQALGAYVIVWWVTLFAVLPWGITPAGPDDVGHSAGAPQRPRLLLKAAITAGVATVVWLVIFALVESPWLSFRGS